MKLIKVALCSTAAIFAAGAGTTAGAETTDDTLTNIVTVVGGCDIIGIGVDFGILPTTTAATTTSNTPNTDTGNGVTANTEHTNAGADEGDALTTSLTSIALVNTAVNTVVSAAATSSPGVYAVCVQTPTGIQLTGDATVDLTVTTGTVETKTYSGNLDKGADMIPYSMDFVSAVTATPAAAGVPEIFLGLYPAASNNAVPAYTSKPEGYYADVITATITF